MGTHNSAWCWKLSRASVGQPCSGKCSLASTILLSHSNPLLNPSCASPEVLQGCQHHLRDTHRPPCWPPREESQFFHCLKACHWNTSTARLGWTSGMGPQLPSIIFCTLSPPGAVFPRRHFPAHSPFLELCLELWCLELDVHSFSQFWHRIGGSEPQSREGTSEAAFSTKAFLVKLPTVCSEHTDKLQRKWEILCPRDTAATSSLSTVTRWAPALQGKALPFSGKLQQFLQPLRIQKVKCHKIHVKWNGKLEGFDKGQVHHLHSALPARAGALSYLWQYPQSPFCTALLY